MANRPTRRWTRGFFPYILLVLIAVPVLAQAKEIFKDEAGRVIYTIDDDGMVSMFESSPTDITLSVTRGTREEMRPQLTDVSPASVAAGNFISLKLKGKNLMGAVVKLSVPEIEIGAYGARPQSLDVPIRVPPNAPPTNVTITVTTPIGSTQGSFKVTDLQLGGTSPSRRDTPKPTVTTAAPASCPAGMIGVAAERGGFCIEIEESFSGDVRKAEKACAIGGKRLCDAAEWRQACELSKNGRLAVRNMLGDWEWTGSQMYADIPGQAADFSNTFDLRSILLGQEDCKTERYYQSWRSETIQGRCCK
jgi:hypothetical protein